MSIYMWCVVNQATLHDLFTIAYGWVFKQSLLETFDDYMEEVNASLAHYHKTGDVPRFVQEYLDHGPPSKTVRPSYLRDFRRPT